MDRIQRLEEMVEALLHRGQGRAFTFTAVAGSAACDAHCPFCVAHMTGLDNLPKSPLIDHARFKKACLKARNQRADTFLITGKGEPTLYPSQISEYLKLIEPYGFSSIELQTNAIQMGRLACGKNSGPLTEEHLENWLLRGLNTIAISVVDVDQTNNQRIYMNNSRPYPPLGDTIKFLKSIGVSRGYSIRLCVMMQKGMVDNVDAVERVLDFCRQNNVEQCTIRSIRMPEESEDSDVSDYVRDNFVDDESMDQIRDWVKKNGTALLTIAQGKHAAVVYDVHGQNLCLSDCLTVDASTDDIRSLIFFPSGEIRFDWQYPGAIFM